MQSDLIAAYARLTLLNVYESNELVDSLTWNIDGVDVVFERINSSVKDTVSGYQGHMYRNTSNNDIIVVHEGSINPTVNTWTNIGEIAKDWAFANVNTVMGRIRM